MSKKIHCERNLTFTKSQTLIPCLFYKQKHYQICVTFSCVSSGKPTKEDCGKRKIVKELYGFLTLIGFHILLCCRMHFSAGELGLNPFEAKLGCRITNPSALIMQTVPWTVSSDTNTPTFSFCLQIITRIHKYVQESASKSVHLVERQGSGWSYDNQITSFEENIGKDQISLVLSGRGP